MLRVWLCEDDSFVPPSTATRTLPLHCDGLHVVFSKSNILLMVGMTEKRISPD
jgi:hypothetical protein